MLSPGLVYYADADDYLRFIQGTGVDRGIPGLGSTRPRDMNVFLRESQGHTGAVRHGIVDLAVVEQNRCLPNCSAAAISCGAQGRFVHV